MIALMRALSGLIGWALGFALLYALHGIAGAGGWNAGMRFIVLSATWLGCIAALAALCFHLWRRRDAPLGWLGMVLGLTGLGATIYTGLPVLLVPA